MKSPHHLTTQPSSQPGEEGFVSGNAVTQQVPGDPHSVSSAVSYKTTFVSHSQLMNHQYSQSFYSTPNTESNLMYPNRPFQSSPMERRTSWQSGHPAKTPHSTPHHMYRGQSVSHSSSYSCEPGTLMNPNDPDYRFQAGSYSADQANSLNAPSTLPMYGQNVYPTEQIGPSFGRNYQENTAPAGYALPYDQKHYVNGQESSSPDFQGVAASKEAVIATSTQGVTSGAAAAAAAAMAAAAHSAKARSADFPISPVPNYFMGGQNVPQDQLQKNMPFHPNYTNVQSGNVPSSVPLQSPQINYQHPPANDLGNSHQQNQLPFHHRMPIPHAVSSKRAINSHISSPYGDYPVIRPNYSNFGQAEDTKPKITASARSASQKLSALYEPDEPGRKEFIDRVLRYWEEKDLPLKHAPLMGRRTLDLFTLYQLVKERGFMQEVTKAKEWADISNLMGLGNSSTSGFTLKKQYCKYLYGLECQSERGEQEPQEALARIIEANRKKKQAADQQAKSAEGNAPEKQQMNRTGAPHYGAGEQYGCVDSARVTPHRADTNIARTEQNHTQGFAPSMNMHNSQPIMPVYGQHMPYPHSSYPTYSLSEPVYTASQLTPQVNSVDQPRRNIIPQSHTVESPSCPSEPCVSSSSDIPKVNKIEATVNDAEATLNKKDGTNGNKENSNKSLSHAATTDTVIPKSESESASASTVVSMSQSRVTYTTDVSTTQFSSSIAQTPSAPSKSDPVQNHLSMGKAFGAHQNHPIIGSPPLMGEKRVRSTPPLSNGKPVSVSSEHGNKVGMNQPFPNGGMEYYPRQSYGTHLSPGMFPRSVDPHSRVSSTNGPQNVMPIQHPHFTTSVDSHIPNSRIDSNIGMKRTSNTDMQSPPNKVIRHDSMYLHPQTTPYSSPLIRQRNQNRLPNVRNSSEQMQSFHHHPGHPRRSLHDNFRNPFPVYYGENAHRYTSHNLLPSHAYQPPVHSPDMKYRHHSSMQNQALYPPTGDLVKKLDPPKQHKFQYMLSSDPIGKPWFSVSGSDERPSDCSSTFTSQTIEGTQPRIAKFRRKTCEDVGAQEAWKIVMALKSGQYAEQMWALNALTILLRDRRTIGQIVLTQLPGLLHAIVRLYRYCLQALSLVPEERSLIDEDISLGSEYEDTKDLVSHVEKCQMKVNDKSVEQDSNNLQSPFSNSLVQLLYSEEVNVFTKRPLWDRDNFNDGNKQTMSIPCDQHFDKNTSHDEDLPLVEVTLEDVYTRRFTISSHILCHENDYESWLKELIQSENANESKRTDCKELSNVSISKLEVNNSHSDCNERRKNMANESLGSVNNTWSEVENILHEDERRKSCHVQAFLDSFSKKSNIVFMQDETADFSGVDSGKSTKRHCLQGNKCNVLVQNSDKLELMQQAACLSNIIRGLSCAKMNHSELCLNKDLMKMLSCLLLLKHKHRTRFAHFTSKCSVDDNLVNEPEFEKAKAALEFDENSSVEPVVFVQSLHKWSKISKDNGEAVVDKVESDLNNLPRELPEKNKLHKSPNLYQSNGLEDFEAGMEQNRKSFLPPACHVIDECSLASEPIEEKTSRKSVKVEKGDDIESNFQLWECSHGLREDSLVTLANLSLCIDLSSLPDNEVTLQLLDSCLHWAVCPSSEAMDAFYVSGTRNTLSPQSLVIEILTKFSMKEGNVDLMLATKPFSRLEQLFEKLVAMIGNSKDQIMREMSIVLLSNLCIAGRSTARTIALSKCAVSNIISFLEECEETGLNNRRMFPSGQECVNCGTVPYMMQRCAFTLLSFAKVPENKPLLLQHQLRILSLAMSSLMDGMVLSLLSSTLYELGKTAPVADETEIPLGDTFDK